MPTLNGIGTKFHGFNNTTTDAQSDVTLWFVFFYFPIIPLKAYRIKRKLTDLRIFDYEILARIPLHFKSVITTCFFGWIVTPLLWFWPLPFAVKEVGQYLGYTNDHAEGGFYYFVITFAIIYLIVFAWKWKDWDEKRGLPLKK